MKTNYLIFDKTSNHGSYINEFHENCNLEENAMIFETEEDAQNYIDDNYWNDWAVVMETDCPLNNF